MLSEALQRNAKHEARLSNISGYSDSKVLVQNKSEIESLASRTLSAALQLHFAQNDRMRSLVSSFRRLLRLGGECFQERRARERQSPEQIPQRKRRISFQLCLIVHAGDARQLSLEMGDRACGRVVCIKITERPAQQTKQFRLPMIALGANLDQLDKIRGSLRAQIITPNSGERIFQHDFRQRMQIGFAAPHNGN